MKLAPHHAAHLIIGLTVWSAWFVVLYGGLSVACELTPPEPNSGPFNWLNPLLGLSTLVVVGALLWMAHRLWRADAAHGQPIRNYVRVVSVFLYLISAFSTLPLAVPVLFLPPCI